jgi:hypothetical protein
MLIVRPVFLQTGPDRKICEWICSLNLFPPLCPFVLSVRVHRFINFLPLFQPILLGSFHGDFLKLFIELPALKLPSDGSHGVPAIQWNHQRDISAITFNRCQKYFRLDWQCQISPYRIISHNLTIPRRAPTSYPNVINPIIIANVLFVSAF